MAVSRRAIFLDKDGTLIDNVPYNVDPRRVRLTHRALEALRRLHDLGFLLIVVSNQPGVAFGYFDEPALETLTRHLALLLASNGAPLAGFYYCPHHPQAHLRYYRLACSCRKPRPGLISAAALVHDIDLARSWVVGDILNDVEAGARAGCRTILLDNGNETEWQRGEFRRPDAVVADLFQAADVIEQATRAPARKAAG